MRSPWVKTAEGVLEGEVKEYDLYLQGECYGYRLFKDGEEEDACWGFLGDIDDVQKALKDYIPKNCEGLIDRLELYWESASDYLEGLESA